MHRFLFCALIVVYAFCTVLLSSYLKDRPVAVKLGYVPSAEVLRLTVSDQKLSVAHAVVVKVLVYYGALVEALNKKIILPPEFQNMYITLQTATKLDPYNSDIYYFAQAAFTWEVGRAKEVNQMLDYGMKYRSWDYMLPFFAGFNAAYFLKQYEPAAAYMQKAAEITGNPLFTNLAARYYFESNNSQMGIDFLAMMEKNAKNDKDRKLYRMRRTSLEAVTSIQGAVSRFNSQFGRLPVRVEEVVERGIMKRLPDDPYGGSFYLDSNGLVRTSSKFAFGEQKK